MTDNTDSDSLLEDWTPYDQFAEERYHQHSMMLEHFELGPGPGPPHFESFPEFPEFFPPPPPIPGSIEECETFSSHFQHCDISKESTSSQDPYLHLMSVIVAVFCLIILASCITIFLVWRRRRSKSHASDLHSYCVSQAGAGQLYDDLYLAGHLGHLGHLGHSNRRHNNYSPMTLYNRNQVDLASFLLQSSPEGQPIYEEIPPGQCVSSDHSSDYVDTTSGYHTLPFDSESETGLFLVPVNNHNKPLIMTKDYQVPTDRKTNKKFFTFHRKTLETNKNPKSKQDHDQVNSNHLRNQFETLDNQHQPKKTRCGKSFVHSKTLDVNNQNHYSFTNMNVRPTTTAYRATYQPNTINTRLTRPNSSRVTNNSRTIHSGAHHGIHTLHSGGLQNRNTTIQRQNQDNFLPRTAWTDTSGSDDWLDVANDNNSDNTKAAETTQGGFYDSRPVCPSPPDLISNKCRTSPKSPSIISTSDVTVSPSSSESYPECRF